MPTLITAAGGNATVIERLAAPATPAELAARGRRLLEAYAAQGAEQAGFLLPPAGDPLVPWLTQPTGTAAPIRPMAHLAPPAKAAAPIRSQAQLAAPAGPGVPQLAQPAKAAAPIRSQAHFAMAGGEFCGNAARAAALLLAPEGGTVALSGFSGLLAPTVTALGGPDYEVSATFPGLTAPVRALGLRPEGPAALVDLGGIVHIVLIAPFPRAAKVYRAQHRRLCRDLALTDRAAVIWCERAGENLTLHPLVWVRALDSFFYESACGSGTIAAAAVLGSGAYRQPSGQAIVAELGAEAITLSSVMQRFDL